MQSIPIEETEALKQLVGPRYQLQSLLGNNRGRKTLLATDRETGEPVVLKLLLFGKEFAWQDLKLFEREAETLRSLEHSAIPQYLDYFDVESATVKGFALVQSYIEARSLEVQVTAGRRFSEADLEQIAQQLLEILDYLHSRQPAVIHRDIKPSNILLTDRTAHSVGQVYLVDFGSVQTLAAREGGTITVVGTYGYMPPEQFGGRAVPASDLYSLGATLIYLASGQHPADLPQDELRLEFEQFVQLSPKMVGWLRVLTEPSLGRRFSSVPKALKANSLLCHISEETSREALEEKVLGPELTSLEIFQNAQGVRIILPITQLEFKRLNRLNFWDRSIIFAGAVLMLGIPLVAILSELARLGENNLEWAISIVLICLLTGVTFIAWAVSRPIQKAEVLVDKKYVSVKRPFRDKKVLLREHVWALEHLPSNALQLSVGDWRILFSLNREERDWLLGLFSEEFGFLER